MSYQSLIIYYHDTTGNYQLKCNHEIEKKTKTLLVTTCGK